MPQIENGFLRLATEIVDALVCHRIPGEQMQCLLFIIRKTYGFNKKVDSIALSQFVEATGIRKQHVCRALLALSDMNMIIVTKYGNRVVSTYSFNKHYKQWKSLPKKVTLPKMVTVVTKNGNRVVPKKGHTKDSITKDTITKDKGNLYVVWNLFAEKNNLSKIKELTKSRKSKLNIRIKEGFDLDKILVAIAKQKFLLGNGNRGWKVTFDWLITNDTNWIKVLELNYLKMNGISDDNIMGEAGRQTYLNGLEAIRKMEERKNGKKQNDS